MGGVKYEGPHTIMAATGIGERNPRDKKSRNFDREEKKYG